MHRSAKRDTAQVAVKRSWYLLGQMLLFGKLQKAHSRPDAAYLWSDPKVGKGEDESTVKSTEARYGGAGL